MNPGIVIVIAVIALVMLILQFSRGQSLLEQWAQHESLRIISSERRFLMYGPYFFTTSKGQQVYHVTAEDAHGHRRTGYVRVGGFFAGILSDKVEVRWDE